MASIRKNGKAYDSGDVVVTLLGSVESETKAISYSTEQEHQVNNSLANRGTSWSMGKISDTASIELYMNAGRKLEKLAPDGFLPNLAPFDIQVTFVNEFNEIVNDTITCKFKNQGREVNGEMGLAFKYDLFVLGISYNN